MKNKAGIQVVLAFAGTLHAVAASNSSSVYLFQCFSNRQRPRLVFRVALLATVGEDVSSISLWNGRRNARETQVARGDQPGRSEQRGARSGYGDYAAYPRLGVAAPRHYECEGELIRLTEGSRSGCSPARGPAAPASPGLARLDFCVERRAHTLELRFQALDQCRSSSQILRSTSTFKL